MTTAPLIAGATTAAGLVVAQPAIPPPPADGGVGTWAVYVLLVLLVGAVFELWRRRLADEKADRDHRAARLAAETQLRELQLTAAREDAASRVQLADALNRISESTRALADEIRACPAHPEHRP